MITTNSGRASRTQLLQIICGVLQTINVSAFVALGYPAEYVAFGAMLVTALQSGIGIYLRTITAEPMR